MSDTGTGEPEGDRAIGQRANAPLRCLTPAMAGVQTLRAGVPDQDQHGLAAIGRAGSPRAPSRGTAHPARHDTPCPIESRFLAGAPAPQVRARRPHHRARPLQRETATRPKGGSSAREATPTPLEATRLKEGARGGTMGSPTQKRAPRLPQRAFPQLPEDEGRTGLPMVPPRPGESMTRTGDSRRARHGRSPRPDNAVSSPAPSRVGRASHHRCAPGVRLLARL